MVVPGPELATAQSAPRARDLADLDGLLFCAGAYAAVVGGRWEQVLALAASLGHGGAPAAAAARLRIEEWLGLPRGRGRRLAAAFRWLLGG